MQRSDLLHDAPIPILLWRLAAPNTAATVLMASVTVADAWYVGHFGTVALASLAVVFPLQTLMQMMSQGAVGGGITSALGRALGRGDRSHAEAVAWHSVLIAVMLSVPFIGGLAVYPKPVFERLGVSGEVLDGAVGYARIVFGGAPVTWVLFALASVLRGTGDTVTPSRALIAASVAQVGISGALTLGIGPVPAMELRGPAIALVLCQACAATYLAAHLVGAKALVHIRPTPLSWRAFADIMKVGALGLVNSAMIVATVVTITGFIAHYGPQALAGYGLGSRLELMIVPIVFGIGGALTAAVSINFGGGYYERARRIAWCGAGVAMAITTAIGATIALVPQLWLDRFTADPDVFKYGALYFAAVAPFYGVFGAGQALYFASQGTGRMLLPVSVGLVRFLIVASVGFLAARNSWDISAVFGGAAAGLIAVGVGMALCLFTPIWRPDGTRR